MSSTVGASVVSEVPAAERGIARIKPEYILTPRLVVKEAQDDDALEADAAPQSKRPRNPSPPPVDAASQAADDGEEGESASKKPKLSGAQKKKLAREEDAKKRKERKGMNTGRKFARMRDEKQLCWKAANGNECTLPSCRFEHDIPSYLTAKPPDIYFPSRLALSITPPFVKPCSEASDSMNPVKEETAAISCPVFLERGVCDQGFKCRFLGGHVIASNSESSKLPETSVKGAPSLKIDLEKQAAVRVSVTEQNIMPMDVIKSIRSRKYPTPKTDAYLKERALLDAPVENEKEDVELDAIGPVDNATDATVKLLEEVDTLASQRDNPDGPARFREKKQLRWEGLNYLAPLTTVGNLPFRRLCVDYGAQVTCGEMALATSLLTGNRDEWSLIRRHPSETMFGIQAPGSRPEALARIAEVFATELGPTGKGLGALGPQNGIDFVDVNCGCPIDMVFKGGAGSALLDNTARLGKILATMNRALGEIPLTIKVRTGVKDGRNTAHKLMPKLSGWGVSAITVHGRTRQQRYTKLADWGYIKTCVDGLRAATSTATMDDAEEDVSPIPIFGGGDVYSAQAYWENVEQSGVDGIMIGRGALVKPWIFTEINERREWDISSRERLEMIRKYAEYGLK
ncbi:tRNA-dihydrouridine synthase 3 [Tulasnella sp. 332]|nr:tRNA-dihydrouridine synthase 3 [Tulasnella sp. 332]